MLDPTILLFLIQDGMSNGAIYALLGLSLVLVFGVTRIIFIGQGELVAFGALTYAVLETGAVPGTVTLALVFGVLALVIDLVSLGRRRELMLAPRAIVTNLALPLIAAGLVTVLAPLKLGALANVLLTLLVVVPLGPLLYRIAYQPIADASVLTLFITSVGVHLALVGLGLAFFGPEGLRASALSSYSLNVGPVVMTGQSLAIYAVTALLIIALYVFFETTLLGKALRATAVNRVGARLVGIRTSLSGSIAFALAAVIGTVSGILIVPTTTIYYDSGFLIGLKGFVVAIIGGLASYPVTALAAFAVGIIEAIAAFEISNYKEVVVFTLIIPVLLWQSLRSGPAHDDEEE